jgi:hypothetical protein
MKVVDINTILKKYENYNNVLTDTINSLLVYADNLFLQAVNLAMKKAYKDLDDSHPVGSHLYISDRMLRECGDDKVIALMELYDKIFDTVGELGN